MVGLRSSQLSGLAGEDVQDGSGTCHSPQSQSRAARSGVTAPENLILAGPIGTPLTAV